ncbi:Indole-3-pyruvate decarboxylase [Rubripirellula lacrimiformis]|uniref:Indole-3-pyruvate decarboxylase n=1 Tax=Rubripirellula lacrimiformis TaxID=1930273 RepID=A0A517NG21_9BACT|nr:thiamine pyrophosphate-dependent enzyme [Rubripirellula lacrimiformis]QDT06084.1 Indole-3-pyruvate decarboxylase [Rubripirellula lacrimiformis]
MRKPSESLAIGGYLIQRLADYGIDDVFGIPGDYVLSFYSQLERSPINVVGCTREDCAGFAADAYARIRGMGAVCVTYCVGGLSVCNSIAGAYAEKSPVVVISGSPGLRERSVGALLHHMVRDFRTQIEVFEKFTIAGAELNDPLTAFAEIDRVLDACDRFKRPVYLELPRDMVHVVPAVAHGFAGAPRTHDPMATAEAVRETIQRITSAARPVIVAGVEMHRFGLQDELIRLAEVTGIPIATTMLGKSVVSEKHPQFVGLYEGAIGDADVTRFVEDSDLVLLLGAFLSDINLGIYSAKLNPDRCVYATSESLRVSHHHYHNVELKPFIEGLIDAAPRSRSRAIPDSIGSGMGSDRDALVNDFGGEHPLRTSRMMQRLNERLDANTIVIADVGDSLFAATELTIHDRGEFLSPAYYTSMGFSVPAALGAATARPDHRIVVLVGDGAFQMTGQELSTLIREGHHPIVILLDNHGYGTERFLHEGDWKYNEVHQWNYSELMKVYGRGKSYVVETEDQYDEALDAAWMDPQSPHLIQAKLMPGDASDTLKKLAARMGENVG